MKADEFLRLTAATAITPDRFCVSFGEGDPEDPFSIILTHDGRFPQPWTRTDVPRRIVGAVATSTDDSDSYAAVSDEGDVYTISGTDVSYAKIAGAGLYSEDALGYGPLNGLVRAGDTLWAFGFGGQLYTLAAGEWRKIEISDEAAARFTIAAGGFDARSTGWFCGSVTPPLLVEGYKPDLDLEARIAAAEDLETYNKLMDELGRQMRGGDAGMTRPLLLRHASGALKRVAIDDVAVAMLTDIHIDSPNRIWIVGSEGAILFGGAETGFQPVAHAGETTENLVSIARFLDKFVIASDYGLFEFDGHVLTRLKPRLPSFEINQNVPNPLRVQAIGDVLMYFDRKHGICRWDGNIWDWVEIPAGLLEREFRGLR